MEFSAKTDIMLSLIYNQIKSNLNFEILLKTQMKYANIKCEILGYSNTNNLWILLLKLITTSILNKDNNYL